MAPRKTPETEVEEPAAAGQGAHAPLDQSALRHVLGHHISVADVPSKKLYFRHIGEPLGLRPVEFSLLVLVQANRDVTQKQLANALALSPPNLTLLLDKLVERDLILRERSAADRRVQHVRLTRDGAATARKALASSHEMEREWSRQLSEAEKAMLIELLQKVGRLRRA